MLAALSAHATDPLFSDNRRIELTLSAPFDRIMRERPDDDELDGRLQYTDGEGIEHTFDVELRTRGNFRRREEVCPFAPLRLDFKKKQLAGTVFSGQNKLKLVTHCKNGSIRYQQGVLRELLAYRILNLLTDRSFRVRQLHMTYQYTDGDKEQVIGYGFFIEHEERLAERLGLEIFDGARARISELDPAHTNLVSVFEFMIGNTDFSPVLGKGDECCHNSTLFRDREGMLWSIPYDFDMSGLANNQYATPNERFGLRSVRERLYRGRCRNADHLDATLARFHEKQSEIEALIDAIPGLTSKRSARTYLKDFFKTIGNPKSVDRALAKACI